MANIMTINVNGLRNRLNRQTIFRKIMNSNIDICFIQESFTTNDNVNEVKNDWPGKVVCVSGTNHSLGTMILLNKHFEYKNLDIIHLSERIICIGLEYDNEIYICMSVYYPNEQNEKCNFHREVNLILDQFKLRNVNIVVGGDFNCISNVAMDNISGKPHSTREIESFNSWAAHGDLFDVWRLFNGDIKDYTWRHKNKSIMRRIDYIFCNKMFLDKIISSDILDIPKTDHRAIRVDASYDSGIKGSGIWKFNNSMLSDIGYAQCINDAIANLVLEKKHTSPQIFWDYCKNILKDKTIIYCKYANKKRKNELKNIQIQIEKYSKQLTDNPDNMALIQKLNEAKLYFDRSSINDLRGAQIRSKIKWIEEGERNTKFFLTLEKVRAKQKIMTKLETEHNIITDQKEIIQHQVQFYKKLYSKPKRYDHDECGAFLQNIALPAINEEDKNILENEIEILELGKALKCLKNNSSPGSDGLTTAWYKFFWPKIKLLVHSSLMESKISNQLSASQRKGIIRLIYKGKGTRNDLKFWRPISLTNIDYRIYAKTVANRLKRVTKYLIHPDQNGYIKGRSPALILRTLDDIIEYTNYKQLPGAMITLDYQKAYDTISKEFMLDAFTKFGFGNTFIGWINIITSNTSSCINYNGNLSHYFNLERGIRQGCPLAPTLFILACEILSNKIRQCGQIRGIAIPCEGGSRMIKLLQYADDSTLLVKDEESISVSFHIIESFSRFTGLQLNRNKTEAIWLGCWKFKKKQLENINWQIHPNTRIKVLGVFLQNNKQIHEIPENWEIGILKCQYIIKKWATRNLTILGRINIAKTFLLPQFLYVMQATILSTDALKKINSVLFKYIWSKREHDQEIMKIRITEKVKRNTMIQDYHNRGLNMIDAISMQEAFAIAWVKKLNIPGIGSWRLIPEHYYSLLSPQLTVFQCNTSSKDFRGLNRYFPVVYRRILLTWLKVCETNTELSIENTAQVLWNNDKFSYKGNCLYIPRWIKYGITFLSDITVNGLISYNKVIEKVPNSAITQFEFNCVYNATRKYEDNVIFHEKNYTIYMFNKTITNVTNRQIRKYFQTKKDADFRNDWIVEFPNRQPVDDQICIFTKMWTIVPECTKEPKLITLQWKILHHIYPTNKYLKKIGIAENDKCIDCNVTDTLCHFFYNCNTIKYLWTTVQNDASAMSGQQIIIRDRDAILGYMGKEGYKICNVLIMVAKQAINLFRYRKTQNLLMLYHDEKSIRNLVI